MLLLINCLVHRNICELAEVLYHKHSTFSMHSTRQMLIRTYAQQLIKPQQTFYYCLATWNYHELATFYFWINVTGNYCVDLEIPKQKFKWRFIHYWRLQFGVQYQHLRPVIELDRIENWLANFEAINCGLNFSLEEIQFSSSHLIQEILLNSNQFDTFNVLFSLKVLFDVKLKQKLCDGAESLFTSAKWNGPAAKSQHENQFVFKWFV